MLEIGASAEVGTIIALIVVSFVSYIAGVVFRKWPDKVQEYAAELDGSAWLVTPETQRAIIGNCGNALIAISIVALVVAGFAL